MAATEPPLFALGDSPGKGKGLFSTRNIPAGTLIISEQAVITIEMLAPHGCPMPINQLESVMHSWKALPKALQSELSDLNVSENSTLVQAALMDFRQHLLLRIYPGSKDISDAKLRQLATPIVVFWQNNFGYTSGSHQALFKIASRINHSCDPNMLYVIDDKGTMFCRAARFIAEDEELTVSYLGTWMSRAARREQYKLCWDFDCECKRCALAHPPPPSLADIPGLPPFTTFKNGDFARVKASGFGVDLVEIWRWMQLQIERVREAQRTDNLEALHFAWRTMAEALGAIVVATGRPWFNVASAEYYKKARFNAAEFFLDTPLYAEHCHTQQLTMELMARIGGEMEAEGLMTYHKD